MGGYTGTWTEDTRYEVLPIPSDTDELLAGDEVWLKYDLFQLGDYIIGYQVGKVEKDIEEDGRFFLKGYIYDPEAKTLILKCIVLPRDQWPVKVQYAGTALTLTAGIIMGVVAVGMAWIGYEQGVTVAVRRARQAVQDAADAGKITQEAADEIKESMGEAPADSSGGLLSPISDLAGALIVGAVALIVLAMLGAFK